MKEKLLEMEQYANENDVPIIEKDTIVYIMKLIKENKIKKILEIGSAIGYSTILMASSDEGVTVTTIERDETRYMECLKNVKACNLDQKISVVFQDALEVNLPNDNKYDLIFIDAAKGQNINFFEKFKYFLNDGGYIITDNLNFHGFVGKSDTIESKNLRALVRKIEEYIEFLKANSEFDTEFLNIGDGISVSKKKNEK